MENTKKDGRANNGGARPGAGRKFTEVTESTGFRVNKEALDYLRSIKYPLNAAINDHIKKLAKKMHKQEKKD